MMTRSFHAEAVSLGTERAFVPQTSAVMFAVPKRHQVLLLDDDCSGRQQLTRELTQGGFDVNAADDADTGVAWAIERRPALVVLELRLRAGAGLDVLARLRPQLPASKFVVLTNYGSVASAVRAMRLGATNYLCKPAGLMDVLRAAEERAPASDSPGEPLKETELAALTLDEAIWEYINRAIEDAGSLSEAARRLGLWRQSLKRMITKYRPAPGRPGDAARR